MITYFECGSHRERCAVPGCGAATGLTCEFALGGRRTGQQCGMAVCEKHSGMVEVEGAVVVRRRVCLAHKALIARRATR